MKFKLQSFIAIFVLLLNVMLPIKEINAQGVVRFQLDLGIQIMGGNPVKQTEYTFDIIQRDENMLPFEGAISYKYDKTSPEHMEAIYLPEGNYTFRLYDGSESPFVREGNELSPKLTQVTDPNAVQSWLDTPSQGSFNDWGNGTIVYDLNFVVKAGQATFNPSTGENEMTLRVLLADQESMSLPVEESDGSSSENLNSEGATVMVPFQVQDEKGLPVSGVTISTDNQSEVTDINGEVAFDLEPGTFIFKITALPEGYNGVTEFDPVTIDQDIETPIILTVQSGDNQEDDGGFTFTSLDENGLPLPGVGIQIDQTELMTDASGQVTFNNLSAGAHPYEVTQVPEGYTLEDKTGSITVVASSIENHALVFDKATDNGELLNVYVTDEASIPVANIEVEIENLSVTTDANGLAKFDNVPEGPHEVTMNEIPEGYVADEEISNVIIYPGTENQLLLGVTKSEEVGELATIQVLDDNAQPVEGIGITLNEKEYFTDSQGEITFDDLSKGDYPYTVTTQVTGYENIPSGTLSVNPLEQNLHLIQTKKIATSGNLKLWVEDQDNQPVVGATINIDGTPYTTDEQGIITQVDLSLGNHNYYIEGLPEGYQGQESNVFTIHSDQDTEVTLQVIRDMTPGSLTIQVLDQNKVPVPDVTLLLDNEIVQITDENGNATYSNLSPGTHSYVISEIGQNYQFDSKEQKVEIKEDSSETRTISVNKTTVQRQLEITMLDQEDKPVNKATVKIGDQEVVTNTSGKALLKKLEPGVYDYSITNLPKDYTGLNQGQVTIPEAEDASLNLYVQRIIKPASALISIVDQNSLPVPGVGIRFGGLVASTDAEGQVYFPELEPGNYYYNYSEFPVGYTASMEDGLAELKEGKDFTLELKIEKEPEAGDVLVTVKDNQQKPVENVIVEVDGVTVETDTKGEARFTKLPVGDYEVKVIQAPQDFVIETSTYQVTVQNRQTAGSNVKINRKEAPTTTTTTTTTTEATTVETSTSEVTTETSNKTTTQATTENTSQATTSSTTTEDNQALRNAQTVETTSASIQPVIVETSLSVDEQKEIEQQAKEATRQFVDSNTGVEVWIHPQDAGNIEKLVVNKISKTQLPSLSNFDADIYQMTLVDKNNQAVALTKVAEVKVPTRPVNSQLKVLRIDQNNLSSLTFALHNRRVTYRTQKLGQFAISYGAISNNGTSQPTTGENTSVNVTKSTSIEKKQDLPGTGEQAGKIILVLAVGILMAGALLLTTSYFQKTKH